MQSTKPRNVLRRKHSGLSQDISSLCGEFPADTKRASSSLSDPYAQTLLDSFAGFHFDRDVTQTPELRVAQQIEVKTTTPYTVTIYPELDRYRDEHPRTDGASPGADVPFRIATHDLPPPTPLFSGTSSQISGFSGSPSTRFSGSPGPGPYSRDTTPTSISSQSPGLVTPMRIPAVGSRMRPLDPALARPPVTRRRADSISNEAGPVSADTQGLAAVRESLTSSSSNSTMRDGGKRDKKKKGLSPLPPSPPPRKSSQKLKKNRDEEESPSKSSHNPSQSLMTSPLRTKPASYSTRSASARPLASRPAPPPARPSRDGTLDLQSDLGRPIPVIQSNLSSTSLSDKRQSSFLASAPVGRPIFSSPVPDQQARFSRQSIGKESATSSHRRTASSESKSSVRPDSTRTTRTPSPSVSAFKSRFPIFGRRTKTNSETGPTEKERSTRKGPAAGTGHEGYGKLGSVRRKSSSVGIVTRPIPGTMSSQDSLGSSHSYDPFFAERLAPVIIAGGEIVENRNTGSELSRTESNQSMTFRRPSIESRTGSRISMSSREESRYTLWPSPFPRGSVQAPSLRSRRPSDSSDSEALVMKSSLALRRSMQRLQSGEQGLLKVPKPIVTSSQAQPPPITSLDASVMSEDSILEASVEPSRVGRDAEKYLAGSGPKKLLRRARSPRKWNFFSRSQSQTVAEAKKKEVSNSVAATVKVVRSKPVAFYTMMDSSEQEDADAPDFEEVVREARNLMTPPPTTQPEYVVSLTQSPPASQENTVRRPAMTTASRSLTSPAKLPSASVPKSSTPAKPPQPPQSSRQGFGRPSRLPQVGRIPKVISARAEQTSPKSFSRPFHRLSTQAPVVATHIEDPPFVTKGLTPPKLSTPELTQDESVTNSRTNMSTTHNLSLDLAPEEQMEIAPEFLTFSSRKDSQCTTTSSSSSGGIMAYSTAAAVVPGPNAPLVEDEIWDEYNDLLGDETIKLPPIERTSSMKPFPLAVNKVAEKKVEPALESPMLLFPPLQSMIQAMYSPKEHPTSSIYSVDMVEQVKHTLEKAQEQMIAPSRFEPTAKSHSRANSADVGKRPVGPRRGSDTSVQQTRYSSSSGMSQGSEDSSPLSQVNLRVGSMTVSKWLTFGHVLFSPVRDELIAEVGSLKRPSILVVDGLGNDDWSFYAAETYPAATFFNLSPRAPLPAEHRNASTIPLSPPNHHQIQYHSHGDKFPFGEQSFTAVVFRFPAAGPEMQYRNIISEARRVLKPGGYIELSILDVDLNNMGNRGRRTVRRLKERIHAKASDTYLGSASDLMLRLLGRKGFTDIKTCRVGVPVASHIPRSSSSEGGSAEKRASGESNHARSIPRPRRDNRTLPELMNDESPVADESITKMVAKVGRWWYSRCYESAAATVPLSGFRGGLWADKPLLSECEELGTSLKLMVCHARAPDGRARVASI